MTKIKGRKYLCAGRTIDKNRRKTASYSFEEKQQVQLYVIKLNIQQIRDQHTNFGEGDLIPIENESLTKY